MLLYLYENAIGRMEEINTSLFHLLADFQVFHMATKLKKPLVRASHHLQVENDVAMFSPENQPIGWQFHRMY